MRVSGRVHIWAFQGLRPAFDFGREIEHFKAILLDSCSVVSLDCYSPETGDPERDSDLMPGRQFSFRLEFRSSSECPQAGTGITYLLLPSDVGELD